MKVEHIDKIKELMSTREKIVNGLKGLNDQLIAIEKELEEQCMIITKEKIQQDKDKK